MMKKNSDSNNNSKNDIYITLKSERNYYQGDVISGAVVLDLQSVKKTQSVKITLEGIALIHNKPTTIYTTTRVLMEPPENEKFIALDAHTHTYNFRLDAPSSKALPSTLDIADILTIQYRLVAIQQVQFGLLDFTKVHPTAEKEVNILERIDVNEFPANYNEMRDIALVGLEKKVRVAVDMLKCAAVKGATIPIAITIHHVGVMVKDRAIKVKLLRNVFYQNTRLNMDGPELITSTNGDIMIIGPTEFTATTRLKLAIPSKLSPTVEETGKTFKVEYLVNVIVNLNEESPHLKQREEEVVIFDIPFTIGTYPQLDYCIDDEDDDEDEAYSYQYNSNNSSQEQQQVTSDTNQHSDITEHLVNNNALDQVNTEATSEPVPPEIVEQQQYKPDELPKQITPPTKQKTMPYELGVQLPVFIENDPSEQITPKNSENEEPVLSRREEQEEQEPSLPQQEELEPSLPQQEGQEPVFPERKEQEPSLPQRQEPEPSLPQREDQEPSLPQREEQEPSLPQQVENQASVPQIKQQQHQEQVSLPIEVPTMHYQSEAGRPMMTKAYSSTSSSENAAGYLPTPSNPSRPSSPSLPYHISHPAYGTNRTSSNGSLPLYGSGINYSSTPELPIEMTPGLEKRSSYLSMNNIPSSPSPPIGQRDPPSFPSRHGQKTSPPIPPRHPSPAFNTKPPLPARPNKPSNNNFSFGPHQPSSAPYQHNGTYGGYNNNTGQMPTVGMPMPMPSPNHTYPEPPLTMPQPQQHYYHHQ